MPVGRAMTSSMPVARGGLASDALAFELGLLIDVAGRERRVLVGRRVLDVAVHADRAAVHDAAHAGGLRELDERADGRRR